MKLKRHEQVVAAWAQTFAGPGWSNRPVMVLVRNPRSGVDGGPEHRVEFIQPREITAEMDILYGVSAAAHAAMTREAERLLKPKAQARVIRRPR